MFIKAIRHFAPVWLAAILLAMVIGTIVLSSTVEAARVETFAGSGLRSNSNGCQPTVTVTSDADNGPGSLRKAIADVCIGGEINFNLSLPATIYISSELVIDKAMAVYGPGATNLSVYPNVSGRAFNVSGAGVYLDGLTIQNAHNSNDGGGIYNTGTLTVEHFAFMGNSANSGGAIYNGDAGMINISNSIFDGNWSNANGGGIYNHDGIVTIDYSTLSDNLANNISSGGGIYNAIGGTLIMNDSTLSSNSANLGGGIYNAGVTILNNSTLSGNSVNTSGGGIYNTSLSTVTINNSTLSHNRGSTPTSNGAAIYNLGTITVNHSTLSGNYTVGGVNRTGGIYNAGSGMTSVGFSIISKHPNVDADCGGNPIFSQGYNLVSDDSCNLTQSTDLPNTDPLLGILQDNGGPTWTHVLSLDSPAIDAGSCPTLTADQRGFARPVDISDIPNADDSCDIGAYELQCTTNYAAVTSTDDSGPGTLRGAISDVCAGGVIDFNLPLPTAITLTDGELLINKAISINGPGADMLTISGNHTTRVFHVSGEGVSLNGLTIADGFTPDNGGGILNTGMLTLSDSALVNNAASVFGGGVYNDAGTLTLDRTTLANNAAVSFGGGVYNEEGNVTVQNSTLSGNSVAKAFGGGIHNHSGDIAVSNSTIVNNDAFAYSGIYNNAAGTTTVGNSIMAYNANGNCGSNVTSLGHNLDSDGSCNLTAPGDLSSVDPLLGPLQDNGGPTMTHAPLPDSPVINATNNTPCPDVDQRGVPRPQGVTCDIGAVELLANLLVDFHLTKTVDDVYPLPDQPILYTLVVRNDGFYQTTSAVISDTLPTSLTFAGPVTLTPFQPDALLAQDADDLPMLASNLLITPGQSITLTLPVTVNADLPLGTVITNVAAVTSDEEMTPAVGSVVIETQCKSQITVTHVADTGYGSLRHAIANLCEGGVIDFDLPPSSTIVLTNGELALTKPLTLMGPGTDALTISGNQNSRVFNVSGNGISLNNLTIWDGYSTAEGGGIVNTGVLTINRVVIMDNSAQTGGGIHNSETGDIIISDSLLTGNSAALGGGVLNISGGTVTVIRSTFSANIAQRGGGVFNNGTANINNTTFSGNAANNNGGGIYNGTLGTSIIKNSTLAANQAANNGGGIYNDFSGPVIIQNSLVANNLNGGDCNGSITSQGYNLDSDGSCNLNGTGDLSNIDPLLGPLQDNGGPTETHALQLGSPAIDQSPDAGCNIAPINGVDQRGEPRNADGDGVPSANECDMGAFEVQPPVCGPTTTDVQLSPNLIIDVNTDASSWTWVLRFYLANDQSVDIVTTPLPGCYSHTFPTGYVPQAPVTMICSILIPSVRMSGIVSDCEPVP